MAQIKFKTKVRQYGIMGDDSGTLIDYIKIPTLTRTHCDMAAFRQHKRYGSLANSDLFLSVLARIKRDIFGASGEIDIADLPATVHIDTTGFLAVVTVDI